MNFMDQFNAGRVPAARILKRGSRNCYAIVHFGLNTFTDREWGYGDEDPLLFNPSDFDAEQVVRACRDGGLSGIILVCKHHDGFCLWPTKTTEFNITKSPFRSGRGDLVREFSDACRKYAMDMGFYVSPWDRNSAYYGTPRYLEIFQEQLREVLSNYGPAFEVWFDGANGGDGYYGGARERRAIDHCTYYDWNNTLKIVRELQPDAAIFSDVGPDLRWAGNEKGYVDGECFGCFTPHAPEAGKSPAPGFVKYQESMAGHADGCYFIPAECDFPLRPGWFYHAAENSASRSLPMLLENYFRSVGCGAYFNLGVAPDRRGVLHENDVARLAEFGQAVKSLFSAPAARGNLVFQGGEALIEFGKTISFNLLELAEDITNGESVTGYEVSLRTNGNWTTILTGCAVGMERLRILPQSEGEGLKMRILASHAPIQTIRFACYSAPEELIRGSRGNNDIRCRRDYLKLSAKEISGFSAEFELGDKTAVAGFIFTPVESVPPGTPDRYRCELFADGVWRTVAEGEFSNLRANPLPQLVEFPCMECSRIRFSGTRMLDSGERLIFEEFGVVRAAVE